MKPLSFKKMFLFGMFLYVPFQSMAWGLLGHRIVGEIAESYLNPKTRLEIEKILGTESIAIASTWADFIRSDTAYNHMDTWHYINFKDSLNYSGMQQVLKQDTGINAYTRIRFLTAELKKKSLPKYKKTMYLRMLIHLVGDIHQPMHTGRKEDSGGNGIRLYWFNASTNLHSLWDSKLVDDQQLSYTEFAEAINHATVAQRKKWQTDPLSRWLFESYQISQRLYAGVKPGQRLSYRYNFDNKYTLEQQLLKGGVRLAGLLNGIFAG